MAGVIGSSPHMPTRSTSPSEAAIAMSCTTWLYVAMKAVKIAELKDSLSEHLRAAERGGGEPVLAIEAPAVPFKSLRSKRFDRLIAS